VGLSEAHKRKRKFFWSMRSQDVLVECNGFVAVKMILRITDYLFRRSSVVRCSFIAKVPFILFSGRAEVKCGMWNAENCQRVKCGIQIHRIRSTKVVHLSEQQH